MSWPGTSDYSEALQYPRTCFVDPELKTASVLSKNRFGIPFGPSGSYAVVYQVQAAAGTWAIKCFVREVPDQHERYAAISKHLTSANLRYTVAFDYVAQGVRLSGFPRRTFPILKMEWVTGRPLDRYIQENLYDAAALHTLASKWIDMMTALRVAGVGHGDLHHGNVTVRNGEFLLLDYDGMTVPSLVGRNSVEVGDRHYQHPARVRLVHQLGPDVDNFPAWVILLSIVAVSVDPSLWYRAAAGDTHLLFKDKDFEAPEQSEILRQLENSPEPQLRTLASTFRHFLYADDLRKIPPLNGVELPQVSSAAAPITSWIHDHIATSSTQVTTRPETPSVPPASLERAATFGRAAILLLFLLCCLLPLASSGSILLLAELVAALLSPIVLYATMQVSGLRAEKGRIVRRRKTISAAIQRTENSVRDLVDAEVRADADERTRIAVLGSEQQAAAQRERAERDRVQAEAQRVIAAIRARVNDLASSDAKERSAKLARVEIEMQQAIAAIQAHRTDLAATEAKERSAELARIQESQIVSPELARIQESYIIASLRAFPIEGASIGISEELKRRLVAHGISTAADVWLYDGGAFVLPSGGCVYVDGFGEGRGQRVVDWMRSCRVTVARNVPRTMDAEKEREIRRRYETELRKLAEREAAVRTKAKQDAQAIEDKYLQQQTQQLRSHASQEAEATAKAQQDVQAIAVRYRQQQDALSQQGYAVRQQLAAWRGDNQKKIHSQRHEILRLRGDLASLDTDLRRCAEYTYMRYVQRVAFLSKE